MGRYEEVIERYGKSTDWINTTFGEQIEEWSGNYKDKIAIVDQEQRITYESFYQRVLELSMGFDELGIGKGNRVAVQLPNSADFLYACFALLYIGAIPVMILPAHREREIEGIFQVAEPVAYIFPKEYLGFQYHEMADKLKNRSLKLKYLISDDENQQDYLCLRKIRGDLHHVEKPDCNDVAVLLLSGGTTGIPKLIARTHVDYLYNARKAGIRCPLDDQSIYLAVLPVEHNFPLACPGILGTLMFGGTVVMSRTTSPDEVFPLISQEKATVTALVPALISLYMDVLEWDEDADLSSLQVVQVGGGKLERGLAEKIIETMPFRLQQNYGTAEGLDCATAQNEEKQKLCWVQGTPISELDEILIINEAGEPVECGEYGELITRGPYTITNYYLAPEADQVSFTKDGFYRTGDKARILTDGNIEIAGRVKEQINRAGEKIIPSEIENYLCSHPEIKEAVVVPVPDKELGNKSFAFLIAARKIKYKEIYDYLSGLGIAKYKIPDEIGFAAGWPLTNVGKIDRKKLGEMAMGGEEHE